MCHSHASSPDVSSEEDVPGPGTYEKVSMGGGAWRHGLGSRGLQLNEMNTAGTTVQAAD